MVWRSTILAGDVDTPGPRALARLAEWFPGVNVVYVLGNHDFYTREGEETYTLWDVRERSAEDAARHGQVPGNACSLHDMRRGFVTTFTKEAGVDEKATATILDYNEGVEASVTNRHYRLFLDGEHEKWPLMQGWAAFIERCADLLD